MRFLCVCNSGIHRSVAMAKELRQRGHTASAVGFEDRTLADKSQYADVIVLMGYQFKKCVPEDFKGDVVVCDPIARCGPHPNKPELEIHCKAFAVAKGW